MKTSSKVLAGVVIVLAVVFFIYWSQKNIGATTDNQANLPTDTNHNIDSNTGAVTSGSYKDGTYKVTSDYMSPGGKDSLGVNITLTGGKISALSVANMATDRTSSNYQNRFISGIQSVAVGQSIGTLKVGIVSGASLASDAFNNALAQVKTQASN